MAQLFKPFVQLDNHYSGTGLGLSLVLRMAELHGGSVTVESDGMPGKGSRFIVTLPWQATLLPPEAPKYEPGGETPLELDPALTLAGTPTATDPMAQGAAVAARPLILIADDNATVVMTLTDFLSFHAYRSVAVANGSEAVAYAQQHYLDLILMDIQMPGVDGLEAIRRLRADPAFASIPIIALTALVMPGDRERCLEAGASEYLTKPVILPKLIQMAEALLRPH
jgi:CheY-like chemotaxis protein